MHSLMRTTAAAARPWLAAIGVLPILAGPLEADDLASLARRLVERHGRVIQPLEIEVARRFWDANVSGTPEAFRLKEEAENRLDLALAQREWFEQLRRCDAARLNDRLLARQIRLLYLQALSKQIDPDLLKQLVARGNAIEMRFNTFRARVGDEQLTASDVRKVLRESNDSLRRRAVWEASKRVGAELAHDLQALVRLRNLAARPLGFADYHAMQLALNEQTPQQVLLLFDEVDELTREPFLGAKRPIDESLARRFGMTLGDLRPWHYSDPFFRDAPPTDTSQASIIEEVYARADVVLLCRNFYAGIGLEIDDVLGRSDLFEKPSKHPSAFCADIDRSGDVRVLANIVPSETGMSTLLHELGHAVYSSKNMPAELPYLLRAEAHTLTTEGVAMMFEHFAKNAQWLAQMGIEIDGRAAADSRADEDLPMEAADFQAAGFAMRRNKLLVFSRFCQVVLRFERELYRDPDQDLNALWWDLVEEYQGLTRPEGRDAPDYACQLHIVTAPGYFHNYLLGELFACQLQHAIARDALGAQDPRTASFVGRREVGRFLCERVFAPGRRLDWNELTKFATGEELSAKAFAADLAE